MWIKNAVEVVFALGLFINALLFIPQILNLYRTKDVDGISLTTFAGFNLIQLFTGIHGFLHEDIILLLGSGASFITCGIVTFLILRYKYIKRGQSKRESFDYATD